MFKYVLIVFFSFFAGYFTNGFIERNRRLENYKNLKK